MIPSRDATRAHVSVRGIWHLLRPVPLAIWSLPTILFGFISQAHLEERWIAALILAVLGAVVLQGIITHGLNDLYDWQSGTDQLSDGIISGGSKVMRQGLLNSQGIMRLVYWGLGIYVALSLSLIYIRGWIVIPFAVAGLVGSVLYSTPPVRLSYRPFLGEWLALFPAMVSGVALGAIAASRHLDYSSGVAMAWFGVFCVASVMQHHYSDMSADWASSPRKRTTPAFWRYGIRRSPKEPVIGYEVLALGVSLWGISLSPRFFLPLAVVTAASMVITATTRFDQGIRELTRRDVAIKLLVPLGVILAWAR